MATTRKDIKNTLSETTLGALARQLVRNNVVDEPAALQATQQARRTNVPLVTYLVENKLARAKDIAYIASREFNLPLYDLSTLDLEAAPVRLVDEKLIRRHRALPLFKRGNRLFLGVADPTNQRALEDIKFQTSLNTEPVVVIENQLTDIIERALDNPTQSMGAMLDEDLENIDISGGEDDPSAGIVSNQGSEDDAPVVRFINRALLDAINSGASDIHFEPYEQSYRVRFRHGRHAASRSPSRRSAWPRALPPASRSWRRLDIAEKRAAPGRPHQDEPVQKAIH